MKIYHLYGLAGMLFVVGVLLWIMQALLWYVGVFCILSGASFALIGLFRFWAPGYVQVSGERHRQRMDWEALRLKEYVLALGEAPGAKMRVEASGSVTVTRSRRVVAEEKPLQLSPPSSMRQLSPARNLEDCLNLSRDFQPHADTILSQRGMVVGISGSGKSNTIATLHEELGRLMVPLVLFDTENEYGSLCNARYLPRGRQAGSTGSLAVVAGNAHDFGRYMVEEHLQVVLDLTSYSADEAAFVMSGILSGLQEWQEEYSNADRVSFMTTLSEAHVWLPQNAREVQCSQEAYGALQSAFFTDLVRRGRKRGLGLTFDLQRIAEVDKRLMQSSWKILHRQTEENDLKRYEAMGLSREDVLSLGDGEAYAFTSQVSKQRIQIRRRNSPHESDTPGLDSIRKRQNALRNFAESPEISTRERNRFDAPVEPFRQVSAIPETAPKTALQGVPETTKSAIVELWSAGKKRTDIQGLLDLNGDEYWMVKAVCDECEMARRG